MFKIRDGRDYFYQWDSNREILVSDPTITQVHFCNRTDDCSLVVEVKELEIFVGNELIRVERYAEVPNILLQDNWKIKVYAFCGDNYTKVEQTFNVKSRTKPADYVYTETEVKTYTQLEKRLDEIEANGVSDEQVQKAVTEYLDENPIPVPEPDLSNYYNKSEVDEKVANVTVDLTGYATEDYVQREIAEAALGGEVDLDGYATEQYVQTEIGKIDIPTVPTNVSAFNNDAKYATEGYVTNAINNLDIPEAEVDLSDYYNKTEVDQKIDAIDVDTEVQISDDGNGNVTIASVESGEVTPADLSNYYTKTEVDAKIDAIEIPEEVDLSNYYTKGEVNGLIPIVPTKVSELTNDAGYLTEHQSLAGYATEAYADALFDGANKAVAYNNYSEMITALSTAEKDAYKVGQNIMIVTLNVPDVWVSSVQSYKASYTYSTDASVIAEFDINGQLQIGYFVVAPLETQKVDLSEYATIKETDNSSTDNIDLNVNEIATVSNYTYSTPIATISNLRTNSITGMSVQFTTADTVTNSDTTAKWIGDDTADGVFTPTASTSYDVYSYYNSVIARCVNMVIKL